MLLNSKFFNAKGLLFNSNPSGSTSIKQIALFRKCIHKNVYNLVTELASFFQSLFNLFFNCSKMVEMIKICHKLNKVFLSYKADLVVY